MKKYLFLTFLVILTVFSFSPTVRAENPTPSDPATAAYISGLPSSIPANTTQWYKFDYVGDKSQVTVLMPDGANTLVEFNVFTPEQSQTWWDKKTKPIGRGTAYQIDCDTGEENYMGQCQSPNLKWVGQFNFPGTFYVQVINYNTGTANFILTVQGTGVRVILPPPPTVPSQTVRPRPVVPLLPVTGGIWWDLLQPRQPTNRW